MKRFCVLLSVVMYFGFAAIGYGAAVISVEPSDIKSTAVGEQLTVRINVTGGEGIAGYQITVNFDPNVLSFVSSANANYLPTGAIAPPSEISDNSVTIAAASLITPAPDGNGTLATVTFEVIKSETTAIYLTRIFLAGPNAQLLESIIADDSAIPPGPAWMPDAHLAAAVRRTLGLGIKAPITKEAMQKLTELIANEHQISDLTGLEYATQLVDLSLYDNQIGDVIPLAGLKELKYLGLDVNQISDISPLAGLTQLESLVIGGNQIDNDGVQILANLTQLKTLSLYVNQISDISPLASLTKLTGLWLDRNQISDVSPLAGLVNLETLYLSGNPIQDLSPLASLTNLRDTDIFEGPAEEAVEEPPVEEPIFTSAGPKIEGPWLWMIVPTGEKGGAAAALSGKDWLAEVSGGSVTEQQIAMNGATAGDPIGDKVWTSGKLAPTGGDNITEAVNTIGLGTGNNIDNFVAYGSISLLSPREQNTTMHVGSDDAVKVWLNGELVHDNPIDRAASNYQDSFPVTLKSGKNILLVAVYEFGGIWSGFFGFENDAVYIPAPTVKVSASERPPMYWINTETGTLYRLIGDDVENYGAGVQNITSLAIDAANGKIYGTQQTSDRTGTILRANLDGSDPQLVKDLTSVPLNITVDAVNGKLYLANSWGKIQRFNLDGSNFESNLITGLNNLDEIAVDAAGGKIYWTEKTSDRTGTIKRANLDGSDVQLVKDLTSVPRGIAVDTVNDKLYLANSWGKVQRFNLDGSNFEPDLITGLDDLGEITVDTANGKIYWTENTGIRRANLDGTNIQDVVTGSGSANIVLGTPIAIDDVVTTVSPPADINEDGRINVTDLLLVVTALQSSEPATPRADVNADGTVTIADLLLVIENLDDPVNASAPMNAETITSLNRVMLETQLNILLAQTDGSLRYQQAITFLQTLLATTRPNKTRLLANYPNPFNPETWIPYQLASASNVKITIYEAKGTLVRTLVLGHQPAGYYTSRNRAVYWDGRNTLGERVASGIYFYQLQADDLSLLRKMIILK